MKALYNKTKKKIAGIQTKRTRCEKKSNEAHDVAFSCSQVVVVKLGHIESRKLTLSKSLFFVFARLSVVN